MSPQYVEAAPAYVCVVMLGIAIFVIVWNLPLWKRHQATLRIDPYLRKNVKQQLSTPVQAQRSTIFATVRRYLTAKIKSLISRISSDDFTLKQRLQRAGLDITPDRFRSEQLIWAGIGFLFGTGLDLVLIFAKGIGLPLALIILVLGISSGFLARDWWLTQQIQQRGQRMLREFPTIVDMLALAVAAGESPLAAMQRVTRTCSGELVKEFAITIGQIKSGDSITQALNNLGERTPLKTLSRFTEGVAVSIERGTALADVLRAQSQDVREQSKRELMESAGKREIYMLIPVVFFILPLVIVFAIFPGIAFLNLGQ